MKTERPKSHTKKLKEAYNKPDVLNLDEIGNARINDNNDRYQERNANNNKEIFWSEGTIATHNRHDSPKRPAICNYKARPDKNRNIHSHAPYNEMYNMAVMPDYK